MIGKRIGQYEIVAELGRGGMGTVYRARQISLNRDVALKILPSHLALDPTGLERFRREAMSVAQLAHPNIVQVYDIGEDGGVHFIAMEYVQGRTAAELIKAEGPLAFRKALEICAPVAAALGVAHKAKIVHRDVKPSNILVSEAGFAKLADFGVAGLMQPPDGERLTMTGGAVGTPYYMSPEQVRGREALDGASDVYSLGVVLYELLSGTHPFGDATTTEAIIKQIQEPFPPIRRYRQNIPDELEQVLARCLAKNREERYQNGEELCQALEKARLRIEIGETEGSGESEDYRKRVSGTGFFYVDEAQKREAKAAVGLRALGLEMVAQVRDPHKKQRHALQALYLQSSLARDEYKRGEKQLEDLRKRQKYHQGKAAQHKAQAQQLIAAGRSDEASASAETESTCDKLALDYGHQAEELGKQVQELRDTYDRLREKHAQAADELALRDAEARRAGKPIPAGTEDARLALQARILRHALVAMLVVLGLGVVWWALTNRPHPQITAVPAVRPRPIVAPTPVPKPAPVAKDGLLLHYTFDKDEAGIVTDRSGMGHNGTVHGAVHTRDDVMGGAYILDGSGHIEITGAAADFRKTTEDSFSVSAWVSLANPVTSAGSPVFSASNDYADHSEGGKFVYSLYVRPDGRPEFGLGKVWRYGLGGATAAAPLTANVWHHLVAVHSNQSGFIYVDGVLGGPLKYRESLGAPARTPILLGKALGLETTNFKGRIGEVRFYNRPLSQREVSQLYANKTPAPVQPPTTGFSGAGSGTPADPYQIANVLQLQEMKNNLTASYVLVSDIDATPTRTWNGGAGFEPIGNSASTFSGNFSGNGHEIRSLYINRPSTDYVGLFGWVLHGFVRKARLTQAKITGRDWTGIIVGRLDDSSGYRLTVEQCSSSGEVRGGCFVGGACGHLYDTRMSDSYSTASVVGATNVAGLCGFVSFSTIERCYSAGIASGIDCVAGLAGAADGTIQTIARATWCFAAGAVQVTGTFGGGFVGHIERTPQQYDWTGSYYVDNRYPTSYGTLEPDGARAFRNRQHAVYQTWDFTNVWQEVAGAYPALRSGRKQ